MAIPKLKSVFISMCAMACLAIPASAQETILEMSIVDASRQPAKIMDNFANVVTSNLNDIVIKSYSGGIDTLDMMALGRGVLDLTTITPVAYDLMSEGKGMFTKESVASELSKTLQLLMWFPYGQHYFAVRAGSEIAVLDDLKGASVYLGPHKLSGPYHDARQWIKATTGLIAGEDFEAVVDDWDAGAQAFVNGDVDVFVSACLDPCNLFSELSKTVALRFIEPANLEREPVDEFFKAGRTPAEIHDVMKDGHKSGRLVKSFETAVGIGVYSSIEEKIVYDITKAYWENLNQSAPKHLWINLINSQYATTKRGSIELHPGAKRYYEEIGILE